MKVQDKKYISLVFEAKSLLSDIEDVRMRIADLAIEACTIKLGGHLQGFYSATNFADDVGMSRKTLSNWIQTRKIQITLKEEKKEDITNITQLNKIRNALQKVPGTSQDCIDKYNDIRKIEAARKNIASPDDQHLDWVIRKAAQVKTFVTDYKIEELDRNKVLHIKKQVLATLETIDKKLGNLSQYSRVTNGIDHKTLQ